MISIAVAIYSIFLAVRQIGKSSIVGQLNKVSVYSIDKTIVDSNKKNRSIRILLYSSFCIGTLFTGVFLGNIVTGGWLNFIISYLSIGIVFILILLVLRKSLKTHADFSIYSYITLLIVSLLGLTTGILINFILLINDVNLHRFTLSENPVSRFIFFTIGNLSLCFCTFQKMVENQIKYLKI